MSTTESHRTLANDPAWKHAENIGVCVKVTASGLIYDDDESRAARARLEALRAKHGCENVRTGNARPLSRDLVGVYLRVRPESHGR